MHNVSFVNSRRIVPNPNEENTDEVMGVYSIYATDERATFGQLPG
jgi:hypothetical protein